MAGWLGEALRKLFGRPRPEPVASPRPSPAPQRSPAARAGSAPAAKTAPQAPAPARTPAAQPASTPARATEPKPAAAAASSGQRDERPSGTGHRPMPLGAPLTGSPSKQLAAREAEALRRIEHRIEAGDLDLPPLSTTAVRVVAMLGNRDVDVSDLVEVVSTDPVLSTELLRMANSALFGSNPVESIREAITRLGLRRLRSRVYAASMQGVILSFGTLAEHSREVLRQAHAAAALAQVVGPRVGIDREKAFLVGLLHDVGRLALLSMLNAEGRRIGEVSRNLVVRVFNRFHERAGASLAASWKLSDELASVAGCHHFYERNGEFPRSAAVASLAHRLDLLFRTEAPEIDLLECPEYEFLQLPEVEVGLLVDEARQVHATVALDSHVAV